MPKTKYDWKEMKIDYMKSDIDELKAFLSEKGVNYQSGGIAKITKGWTKEKQAMKQKIIEKALAKQVEKEAESLTVPISDLMKGKKAMLQLLLFQVGKYVKASKDDNFELDEGKIEKIMKMIKTELGEPSNITQNQNLNTEVNNELTDDEKEALQTLLLGKSKKQ